MPGCAALEFGEAVPAGPCSFAERADPLLLCGETVGLFRYAVRPLKTIVVVTAAPGDGHREARGVSDSTRLSFSGLRT